MLRYETERLIVRDYRDTDIEALFEMWGDPEVCRYTGQTPVPDMDAMVVKFAEWWTMNQARGPDLGSWAATLKPSGEVIGTAILKHPPDAEGGTHSDVEVGWHVQRRLWRQGFATEIAGGVLKHGLDTLGLDRVVAVVEAPNVASLRVAANCGMRHVGRTRAYYGGQELELFVMGAP